MSQTTGIRLTPKLGKSLDSAAKRTGIKKADIIRVAVAAFLATNSKPEQLIASVIQHRTAEAMQ